MSTRQSMRDLMVLMHSSFEEVDESLRARVRSGSSALSVATTNL